MRREILELAGGPAEMRVLDPTTAHPHDAGDFLRWCAETTSLVAFDIETDSLDYDNLDDDIKCIQIGNAQVSWVLYPQHRIYVAQGLRSLHRPAAHNGLFDATWLELRLGVPMQKVVDRMTDSQTVASLYDPRPAHFVDEDADPDDDRPVGLGLKDLTVRYIGTEGDRYERELYEAYNLPSNKGKVWSKIWKGIPADDPYMQRYAAADVVITCRLAELLLARMNDNERDVLLPIERRITAEAFRIIRRGMDVDTDAAAKAVDVLMHRRRELDVGLTCHGIGNADSTQQVCRALLDAGAELTAKTSTGAPSTNRIVLQGLTLSENKTVAQIAGLVRSAKQAKRYANTYAQKLAASGGMIHPMIRVDGTRTRRWSVSDPPIQQWPKEPLAGPGYSVDMRGLFLAPAGKQLISCDLASIEVVIGAVVSKDINLLKAVNVPFEDSIRVYENLAEQIGVERKVAKTMVLGGQYGAGADKMAVILGTKDIAKVKRLKAETFGGWWCEGGCTRTSWSDSCDEHRVWEDGFYNGPRTFGRRVTKQWGDGWRSETRDGWPGIRSHYGRWVPAKVKYRSNPVQPDFFPMYNHTVQGTARDLLMRMLIRVTDAGLDPWLTVHDEIVIAADPADALDARQTLVEIMSTPEHEVFGVPIRCEASDPSTRWGKQSDPVQLSDPENGRLAS